MRRMCLGVLAFLAVLAAPAWATQEEKIWTGKRWEWVNKAPAETYPLMVEVAREEAETTGMKTVGKNVVTAYYRRAPAAEAPKGHACVTRYSTVLKHLEVRHYCRVDGVEKPCPGMTPAGECLAVLK